MPHPAFQRRRAGRDFVASLARVGVGRVPDAGAASGARRPPGGWSRLRRAAAAARGPIPGPRCGARRSGGSPPDRTRGASSRPSSPGSGPAGRCRRRGGPCGAGSRRAAGAVTARARRTGRARPARPQGSSVVKTQSVSVAIEWQPQQVAPVSDGLVAKPASGLARLYSTNSQSPWAGFDALDLAHDRRQGDRAVGAGGLHQDRPDRVLAPGRQPLLRHADVDVLGPQVGVEADPPGLLGVGRDRLGVEAVPALEAGGVRGQPGKGRRLGLGGRLRRGRRRGGGSRRRRGGGRRRLGLGGAARVAAAAGGQPQAQPGGHDQRDGPSP